MISIAIIVNPKSGKGRGANFLLDLKKYNLPPTVSINIIETTHPLHAVSIAQEMTNNFNRIIIAGGDGTLNEFINGFDIASDILLGLLPIGSGNDFAISLNKNKIFDLDNYLDNFIKDDPKVLQVDIGSIELYDINGSKIQKRFINSLGIGFDARVAYLNQTNKILSGSLSYITAIIRAFLNFKLIDFTINTNNKVMNKSALFCSIGNGESVGGGLYLMPGAEISDGELDLSIVDLRSRLKLLRLLPKAMKNNLIGVDELEQYRFNELEIELKTPYYSHVDGEIVSSETSKIKVSVLPKVLNFMMIEN